MALSSIVPSLDVIPASAGAAREETDPIGAILLPFQEATVSEERSYQMLWDCPFCGTGKLLGLDHRHCPACGAAQDPELRYFPADEDKVAVEDHEFTGADVRCGACDTPNAARSKHCVGCGSALEGASAARTRSDQVAAEDTAFGADSARAAHDDMRQQKDAERGPVEPPPKQRSKVGCIIGCAVVAVVLVVIVALVALLWKKPTAVTVSGHSWERTIEIERFEAVSESEWCDSKPKDAYQVRKERKVRSHEKIPDGEDCKTRRVDNGDGTFTEKRECTPRYREEPVHDDWCSYKVDRWRTERTERSAGDSLADAPAWPVVTLAREGKCKGCEREGKRGEDYTVHFAGPEGDPYRCDYPEATWRAFAEGMGFETSVGVMTKKLDCDSITP
jgi:predicted nucleic acid-binding Zn ribbon protein